MSVDRIAGFVVFIAAYVNGERSTWNGPLSAAVVVGDHVTLSCQPPVGFNSVDWYFTQIGSVDKSVISRGKQVFSFFKEFSVTTDSVAGQTLTLSSARMKHAGIYACAALLVLTNETGRNVEWTAHLTVLETIPRCAMNKTILKEGDEVSMTCTVRFNGSLAPTMKWTEERRTGAAAAVEGFWRREGGPSETTVVDNLLTSTVRVIVDYRLNNASYSCSLYFQRPSEGLRRVNASNAPSYNYTWTSALLQVNYGPNEVRILRRKSVYSPGDVLTCDAKSSPEPHFQWKNLETGEVLEGRELFIRGSMTSQLKHSFNCKARNDRMDRELASDNITFLVSSNDWDQNRSIPSDDIAFEGFIPERSAGVSVEMLMLIALPVSGVVVLIISALIFYVVHLKRRETRRDRARLQNASSAMSLGAPFSSSVNCNNTNYTSEYSEIPSYSTCREAVERCNYTGLSNTAPAYLSMSQNSSTSRSSSRRDPSRNQSCQNNIYMEPDDNEEEEEPSSRYSVVLRSPKSEQTKDICREKERWNSKSPPASTGNREERENMEQRGNLKCSFTGSKVQESSDYLEPFDIQ